MKIIDRGLVFDAEAARANIRCAAFPRPTRLHDGALLCCFNVGPQKLSPEDHLRIMRSTDDGQTWHLLFEDFPTSYNGTPGSLCSGYIFEREPGKLFCSQLWVDRTDPDKPLANPETTGVLPMKCLLSASSDSGRTWSAPMALDTSPCPGSSSTDAIVRLNNGHLLAPFENWREWDETEGTQKANALISKDGGKAWSKPITMASEPEQRLMFWDNRIAKDPDTGELVVMYWTYDQNAGKDVNIHINFGEPDGRMWSVPHDTGIEGQIAAPLPLGNGKLLCAYVHRNDPPSIRVVTSDDMGKTWNVDQTLTVYDSGSGEEAGTDGPRMDADYWEDMYRWTFGHPHAVRLDDSTVLVTFYGGEPTALSVHWVKIAL